MSWLDGCGLFFIETETAFCFFASKFNCRELEVMNGKSSFNVSGDSRNGHRLMKVIASIVLSEEQ